MYKNFLRFVFSNPHSIGVEISSTAVKLLALSRKQNKFHIDAFTRVPLPEGAVINDEIKDSNAVSSAITQAINISGTTAKFAAIALNQSVTIIRVIQIDAALTESQIEAKIFAAVSKFIPYALQEARLDFCILGEDSPAIRFANGFSARRKTRKTAGVYREVHDCRDRVLQQSRKSISEEYKLQILVAVAKASLINQYLNIFQQTGLTLKIIEIEAFAIANACAFIANEMLIPPQNIWFVADIGHSHSTFTLLRNSIPIYSRSEMFGGKDLTHVICKEYKIDFVEAEAIKINNGENLNGYEKEILQPFKETIATKIKNHLQLFETSNNEKIHIDCLMISGGIAKIEKLDEFLLKFLNVKRVLINPLANIFSLPQSDRFNSKIVSFLSCSCFGSALGGFDW